MYGIQNFMSSLNSVKRGKPIIKNRQSRAKLNSNIFINA